MNNRDLEVLVNLQDLDMMIVEMAEVEKLGFNVQGKENLEEARNELIRKMSKPLLYKYEKLKKRYKRAIVPVQDDVCLGCFMRLPTSFSAKGREDAMVYECEGCGRILYWLD